MSFIKNLFDSSFLCCFIILLFEILTTNPRIRYSVHINSHIRIDEINILQVFLLTKFSMPFIKNLFNSSFLCCFIILSFEILTANPRNRYSVQININIRIVEIIIFPVFFQFINVNSNISITQLFFIYVIGYS